MCVYFHLLTLKYSDWKQTAENSVKYCFKFWSLVFFIIFNAAQHREYFTLSRRFFFLNAYRIYTIRWEELFSSVVYEHSISLLCVCERNINIKMINGKFSDGSFFFAFHLYSLASFERAGKWNTSLVLFFSILFLLLLLSILYYRFFFLEKWKIVTDSFMVVHLFFGSFFVE